MGEKMIALFTKIHETQEINYDWFIIADDDGYIFMDNFYKFIATKNPLEPMMYGSLLTVVVPGGYITGGPGIVITRESMLRVSKKMAAKECYADKFSDVTLGLCAKKLGIGINEAKDATDKYRFHNLGPEVMYRGPFPGFIKATTNHTGVIGKNCCSLDSIGFHYVTPEKMYEIDANQFYLQKLLV
jgi:glycoprotein-N-acetylgalactosamine 3-beta-galactosyltransferase